MGLLDDIKKEQNYTLTENGALAYVDSNFNIPDAAAKCPLEFYGTKGSITALGTLSQDEGGSVEILVCEEDTGYDAQQNRSLVKPVKLNGLKKLKN